MATRIIARDNTDPFNLEQKYDVIIHENANDWIRAIQIETYPQPHRLIVGLDIKLRSRFNSRIVLLTLCVPPRCLIFELTLSSNESVPGVLREFLSDKNNTFVGYDMESKIRLLQRQYGLGAGTRRHDVGALVARQQDDMRNVGLNELRMFLRMRDVQRPVVPDDWDAVELSNAQVHRACVDAYLVYELGSDLVNPILKNDI